MLDKVKYKNSIGCQNLVVVFDVQVTMTQIMFSDRFQESSLRVVVIA